MFRNLGSQDYENFEIIAIDDSSEDKTGEIIEKFSKENSKIIHVSAKENLKNGWERIGHVGRIQKSYWRDIAIYRRRYKI